MDLVLKDTGLFDNLAKKLNAPLEISPQIVKIFKDGQKKYGSRALVINDCKKDGRFKQY
jgi:3-hydroxyisobutyrate dehydrogenase